ncbi:MAG: membrane protein insertase YidC [Deltaproteobacteria bacterium]|nr:membrane protein insertase YidC [Deltaproteobacteria bacterium]
MEQARLMLAIVISFLIFLVWGYFFEDKTPNNTNIASNQNQAADKNSGANNLQSNPLPLESKNTVLDSEASVNNKKATFREPKVIKIDSPLYSAELSEKGSLFKTFSLKNYKETTDEQSPYKNLINNGKGLATGIIGFESGALKGLNEAIFTADAKSDYIEVNDSSRSVTFSFATENGVTIKKRYTFFPDSYLIKLDVNIENRSSHPINDSFFISLYGLKPTKKSAYGFVGPSGYINGKLREVKVKNIPDENSFQGKTDWLAFQTTYFMASIMPENSDVGFMKLFEKEQIIENRYVNQAVINPNTVSKFEYNLFIGPKDIDVLKSVGHNLEKSVNFGMFDFIVRPCRWLLNAIYGAIPNYGIAIIILTLITKIVLWPLGSKSYKSMNKMKKIQPLMTQIREKYKHDKQKMNAEVMNLYKTYKINPAGGCLPMILQIPIFFALYRMLYQMIELRHAPFFLWIDDLAAPDRLFRFDFSIPMMSEPYGIPVLTIIMGASMFLQQKMSPPPGDPSQAKIMLFLPIIFTVLFVNFSSGLVLYWLINNLASMGQQYYISKKYA